MSITNSLENHSIHIRSGIVHSSGESFTPYSLRNCPDAQESHLSDLLPSSVNPVESNPTDSNASRLIPPSYIFSYWIFIWAFTFIVIKYSLPGLYKYIEQFNPTLVLLIALIWNTESLFELIANNVGHWSVFKYALMIFFIKFVPLYLIWTWDIRLFRDGSIIAVLFGLYSIYLWFNGTDFFKVYRDLTESILHNQNRTPFEYYFDHLYK